MTSPHPGNNPDGGVTFRELVAMLEGTRKEILAELRTLETEMVTQREKEAEVHASQHRRESDRAAGFARWAVTTLLTGAGVLIALWASLGRG